MVAFSPAQVCAKIGTAGKGKCTLPPVNMFVRAFLAGAYIAMGASVATVGSTGVATVLGAGIAQFVTGALFPIGLMFVVLTGAELFTGDAMFAPMAILQGQATLAGLAYLWIIVYIGNFIGSIFMAVCMTYGPLTTTVTASGSIAATAFGARAVGIAVGKVSYAGVMGILSVFIKGILCNWLVCLAIFLALAADDIISKIMGIWFPIMGFVAAGYEHCVANMYFIPAGILTMPYLSAEQAASIANINLLGWTSMITSNLIWSTLGNIVGAAFFMACIYYYCYKKEIEAIQKAA